MHLGIPALLDFFRSHRNEEFLVLATIIATEGSTYRKPGAMMLISRDGSFEGMISGGCLEGDLLQHANNVFETGQSEFVTYDMHAGEDLVWSLGVGCDGIIHLMLQRLDRAHGFGFLPLLEQAQQSRRPCLLALTTESVADLNCGAFALIDPTDISVGEGFLQQGLKAAATPWPDWRVNRVKHEYRGTSVAAIQVNIPAQTRVLVCGAGPDAVPVARVLCELDWGVVVVDHRPAYAKRGRFPGACTVIQCRPGQLSEMTDLDEMDAVVIMSHHLENDSLYLRQVAKFDIPYIGVLGPRARSERLCRMAECTGRAVYGPVGLDIGAELPGAIALSLAAEIHAVLNHRDGAPLTLKVRDSS